MKGFGERVPSPRSFQNLRLLEVRECDGLVVVIPCNWIRNLPKLEHLRVDSCSSVTGIIEVEGIADEPAMTRPLANLKMLNLSSLKEIRNICKGTPGKVISFSNLRELRISECKRLAFIFSPYMSQSLCHLQKLIISDCYHLREIFEVDSKDELQSFQFPELEMISVKECENLWSPLFPVPIARGLVKLRELDISHCARLGKLVNWADSSAGTQKEANNSMEIELPCLTKINIYNLYRLERFCSPEGYSLGVPSLQELKLTKCPKLPNLTSDIAADYGLTKIPASARVN